LLSHTDKNAIFKARVTIVDSNGVLVRETSGHGSEDKDDFRDFLEKAETKAIGRALAAAGYGSQFATDFEFGADQGRVVDAPVGHDSQESGVRVTRPGDPPSAKQIGYLERLLQERDMEGHDVQEHLRRVEDTKQNHGDKLDRATASNWIKQLTEDRIIPVIEGMVPKAEGADAGAFTSGIRAKLLVRNDKERTVWKNVIAGLNREKETWRALVATAKTMTTDSDDPMREAWRFILLVEQAPLSGEIIDGIATVADKAGAVSPDLEDAVAKRFLELG
jgi:hypothetical protein